MPLGQVLHLREDATPMPLALPNLQALLDRLPQGSLARELVATFKDAESRETVRDQIRANLASRVEGKKEELRRAEDQMD